MRPLSGRASTRESVPVVVKSDHDRHPMMYMPSRVAEVAPVVPESCGLTGIEKVPEIGQQG